MTAIHLTTNLHEKMEYILAQYIGELHDIGIIEKAKEFLRSLLPATLPNCSGNP